jgi:gluconate 2-dehydrogenase gamma chain
MTFISRRDLLKRAGLAAAALPVGAELGPPSREHADQGSRADQGRPLQATVPAIKREPLENLTATEMDLLDAIVARLIPTDVNGPGATEARATHYIDRALGGALASSREAYTAGLAAFDRYARSSRGGPFTELSPTDQDSLLIDVETGAARGFTGSSAVFFNMILSHTHQGTFGDPYYGGNANFIGWDLISYPGVRTIVTASDQQHLESNEMKPNHKSAYDHDMFTKASARAGEESLPRRSPRDTQAKAGAQDLSRRSPGEKGA